MDGKNGLWTVRSTYDRIVCPIGGTVVFFYPLNTHDVVEVNTPEAWEACNLVDAKTLSPLLPIGTSSESTSVTYFHNCTKPGLQYLTCSVPGHCSAGQKVLVETTTDAAWNSSTGDWNLHVDSVSQLLTILGYRQDAASSTFVMDRGFQTESIAAATADLIWCALDHCPMAAHDFDLHASNATCASIIFTLLGFVQRKRPIPRWELAEDYYDKAIALGGPNQCAAESYKAQLFLNRYFRDPQRSNLAVNQIDRLCQLCSSTMVRQAQVEYERLVKKNPGDSHAFLWEDACQSTTRWILDEVFVFTILLFVVFSQL